MQARVRPVKTTCASVSTSRRNEILRSHERRRQELRGTREEGKEDGSKSSKSGADADRNFEAKSENDFIELPLGWQTKSSPASCRDNLTTRLPDTGRTVSLSNEFNTDMVAQRRTLGAPALHVDRPLLRPSVSTESPASHVQTLDLVRSHQLYTSDRPAQCNRFVHGVASALDVDDFRDSAACQWFARSKPFLPAFDEEW